MRDPAPKRTVHRRWRRRKRKPHCVPPRPVRARFDRLKSRPGCLMNSPGASIELSTWVSTAKCTIARGRCPPAACEPVRIADVALHEQVARVVARFEVLQVAGVELVEIDDDRPSGKRVENVVADKPAPPATRIMAPDPPVDPVLDLQQLVEISGVRAARQGLSSSSTKAQSSERIAASTPTTSAQSRNRPANAFR